MLEDGRNTNRGGLVATLTTALALVWLVLFVGEKIAGKPGLSFFVLLALMLAHGSITIGGRALATFAVVTMAISFLLEASSIAMGFPFGFYVHHAAMPRPLGVPLIVPPSYMVYAYLGWRISCAILRCEEPGPSAQRLIAAPLLAGFVIPGFDLVVDAMGSTVAGGWTYAHPSGYFGVPLSNFLGWIFTSWAMIQAYALIEALAMREPRRASVPMRLRLLPAAIWLLTGLQFTIDLMHRPTGTASVAGRTFLVGDIAEASLIVGLLAMVPPALAALFAIVNEPDHPARR